MNVLSVVSADCVAAMRDWVAECDWIEDPETIDELSDAAIVRGVARHYDGGVAAFIEMFDKEQEEAAAHLSAVSVRVLGVKLNLVK